MLFPVYILVEVVGLSDWAQIVVRAVYFGVAHALLGFYVARQIPSLASEVDETRDTYLRSQSA